MHTKYQARSNFKAIKHALGYFLLVIYEALTTQIIFLPPFIGLFFAYILLSYARRQKSFEHMDLSWYLALVFVSFAECIHGFYLFSTIIAFLLFFHFVADKLFSALKYRSSLLAILVASGYGLSLGVSNLFAYVQNKPFLPLSKEYLIYIVVEIFAAIVLFRTRVL